MPVSAFTKFEKFSEDLSKKVHNLDTDTLSVYLTNATPNAATHSLKSDIAEISTGNGYTGPQDSQNVVSRSGGVTSIVGTDVVITASGAVGPFRYAILFNDTPTSPLDPLVGFWDYGAAITLQSSDVFTVDFGTSLFTVT